MQMNISALHRVCLFLGLWLVNSDVIIVRKHLGLQVVNSLIWYMATDKWNDKQIEELTANSERERKFTFAKNVKLDSMR